jgi:hypothetical protein
MRRWDVIVFVGIVVVAVNLLAVGILRLRESADRNQCQDHLRNIAVALHDFQDSNKRFPSATLPNDYLPPEKRLSWLVPTFGFIDGQLSFSLDRAKAWDAEENREPKARGTEDEWSVFGECALFLCPANPRRSSPGWPSLTHYVGVAGLGKDAVQLERSHPKAGVFGYRPPWTLRGENPRDDMDLGIRLRDIQDGPATTLLVIETNRDNGPWTAGGPPTVRGLDPEGGPYLGKAGQFGSYHWGGTHAAFADASVRFLAASIDPRVFEALATIAGGEKVGDLDAD